MLDTECPGKEGHPFFYVRNISVWSSTSKLTIDHYCLEIFPEMLDKESLHINSGGFFFFVWQTRFEWDEILLKKVKCASVSVKSFERPQFLFLKTKRQQLSLYSKC